MCAFKENATPGGQQRTAHSSCFKAIRNIALDVLPFTMTVSNSKLCSQDLQEPTGKWERLDFWVRFEASLRLSTFININSSGSSSQSTRNCQPARHPPGCIRSQPWVPLLPLPPHPMPSVTNLQICIRFGSALQVCNCQILTASIRACHKDPQHLLPSFVLQGYPQTSFSVKVISP